MLRRVHVSTATARAVDRNRFSRERRRGEAEEDRNKAHIILLLHARRGRKRAIKCHPLQVLYPQAATTLLPAAAPDSAATKELIV